MTDRVAYTSHRPKPKKRSWRDRSDSLLPAFNSLPSAQSLHPDTSLMVDAITGSLRAKLIIESWRPDRMWAGLIVVAEVPA